MDTVGADLRAGGPLPWSSDPMSTPTTSRPVQAATSPAAAFRETFRRVWARSANPGSAHEALRAAAVACREELADRWV
jgi:hypothetical protein